MDSRARARDDLVQYPITMIPPNNGDGSDDDFLYYKEWSATLMHFSWGSQGVLQVVGVPSGVSGNLKVSAASGSPGRFTLPQTRWPRVRPRVILHGLALKV